MERITRLGRYFFAGGVAASGVQQLVNADFVRLVPKLPAWLPGQPAWACVVGALLAGIGVALGAGRKTRPAAILLGALLLLTFFLQRVPEIVANPSVGFMWTNPCKVLALLGGAILLAGSGPTCLGALFLGVFLLVCGAQHFVYAEFVQTLVPAWIPPGPKFWAAFTGVALMAGGLGILLPPTVRWAAGLSGLMIFLWVILLHLPRALASPHDAGETSAIFEALALSGVALLVAGTRGRAATASGP